MKPYFLLAAILFCQTAFSQQPVIKNLVLEGGGIRGIAYLGALDELQKNRVLDSVQQIAGTSAGGIVAALLAVGYTTDELTIILSSIKFQRFNDNEFGFITGSVRLLRKYGWYKGNKFENFMAKLIAQKTGNAEITLAQLHALHLQQPHIYKDLYLTATDLISQQSVILDFENYGNMPLHKAVRCTMSIPFYFKAVKWHYVPADTAINAYDQLLVDGGVLLNYPIHIFDNRFATNATLGFRLDDEGQSIGFHKKVNPKQAANRNFKIKNIRDYTISFYDLVMSALNDYDLTPNDFQRTISISPGRVGQKVKRLKKSEVDFLVESGRKAAKEYLSRK